MSNELKLGLNMNWKSAFLNILNDIITHNIKIDVAIAKLIGMLTHIIEDDDNNNPNPNDISSFIECIVCFIHAIIYKNADVLRQMMNDMHFLEKMNSNLININILCCFASQIKNDDIYFEYFLDVPSISKALCPFIANISNLSNAIISFLPISIISVEFLHLVCGIMCKLHTTHHIYIYIDYHPYYSGCSELLLPYLIINYSTANTANNNSDIIFCNVHQILLEWIMLISHTNKKQKQKLLIGLFNDCFPPSNKLSIWQNPQYFYAIISHSTKFDSQTVLKSICRYHSHPNSRNLNIFSQFNNANNNNGWNEHDMNAMNADKYERNLRFIFKEILIKHKLFYRTLSFQYLFVHMLHHIHFLTNLNTDYSLKLCHIFISITLNYLNNGTMRMKMLLFNFHILADTPAFIQLFQALQALVTQSNHNHNHNHNHNIDNMLNEYLEFMNVFLNLFIIRAILTGLFVGYNLLLCFILWGNNCYMDMFHFVVISLVCIYIFRMSHISRRLAAGISLFILDCIVRLVLLCVGETRSGWMLQEAYDPLNMISSVFGFGWNCRLHRITFIGNRLIYEPEFFDTELWGHLGWKSICSDIR